MSSKLLFALVLFFSLTAAAQFAPANTSSSASTYSVTGIVENSVTGEPIPHALVQLGGESQKSAFTDSGGRFEFELRSGITVVASARKPGFLSPLEIDPTTVQPLLQPGPEAPPLTLRLIPEGVVFGRAQKPDGEPIGYLSVQLFYSDISEGRRRVLPMNSAQTNDDGEFRIPGLKPGTYYLQAGPRNAPTWIGAPGQRAREAGYRPVFFPGGSDLASAAPLEVSPGQQVEADLSLNPDPVFQISGTVSGLPANDAGGEVWPRITILPRDNRSAAIPVQPESSNGFEARVPAGSYIVRADVDTPQGPYGGDLPVTVQSNLSGLNLMVAPAPELRVEVSAQRTLGDANPGRRPPDQVNVHFMSQDMKEPTVENSFTNGTVRSLEPGVYAVEIMPLNSGLYVDSAQCGGVNLLRDNLMISPGTPPIRVVLRDDGGTLAGNVTSDGRAAPGTVLIIPDRAPKQIKTVVAGAGGQFQSPKLAPGDYTVLAFDRTTGLEYANPEVISSYLSNATHVSVGSNGESRVTVNLIRTTK
jgi:hypothetical protein